MKPSEQLKEEHDAIKLMLQILEKVSEKLESGEEINTDHLDQILEFIKVFADKCHHGKEEDLLFPAMVEAGMPRQGGPISVMLTEHDMGRGYVKAIDKAITEYKNGDRQASSRIVENARKYVELLTQHINKEDNVLYPMGDTRLSDEKQKELLEQFESVEREKIGVGKHEEFHRLVHHLKETYLE